MTDTVLTKDVSSGRMHRRIVVGDRLVPFGGEQDNLDDAGQYVIATSEDLANAEPGQLCERCFPDVGDPEEAA